MSSTVPTRKFLFRQHIRELSTYRRPDMEATHVWCERMGKMATRQATSGAHNTTGVMMHTSHTLLIVVHVPLDTHQP